MTAKQETLQIEADTARIRNIRLEMAREFAAIEAGQPTGIAYCQSRWCPNEVREGTTPDGQPHTHCTDCLTEIAIGQLTSTSDPIKRLELFEDITRLGWVAK